MIAASISTISSRSAKLHRIGVIPPRSRAYQPRNSMWLAIRFSSPVSTRMYSARRGTCTSSSFSKDITGLHSQKRELMYSSGSSWLMMWWKSEFSAIFSTPRCR